MHKSEAVVKFKEFVVLTRNKFSNSIKSIRSDNAEEYLDESFEILDQSRIERRLSIPNYGAQNGISERKNKTIVEMARTMPSDAKLPKHFWGGSYLDSYVPNQPIAEKNK